MRRVWFAAALLALIAWGDPSQLLSQENIVGWGALTDPDGDSAPKVEGGRLSFTLIGRHDLDGNLPWNMNAPRVLQEVEGDFVALVSVGGAFKPKGPSTVADRRPYNGAGFVIWQDEKNYVRLDRAAVEVGEKTPEYLNFQHQSRGAPNMQQFKMGLKGERVQIRLERRNSRLYAAASYDGRLWQGYEPVAVDLPDRVHIGITAISTSSIPFEPEFEGLEIYRRVAPAGQKVENAR